MIDSVRHVGAHLVLAVHEPVRASLQLAVPSLEPAAVDDQLTITCDGLPLEYREVVVPGNGRIHLFTSPAGRLEINYSATVRGAADPAPVTDADRIIYRRPSRYAESDRLSPVAQAEFDGITDAEELLVAVSSWVGTRLSYVLGSSGPTDGAVDTLLKRRGVCRDYAHLVVALLRGLDIPARLAAVYAPGLDPMDFHAVAEVAVGDIWQVVDATLLAPRASLVRIATGRDAADTAFLSTYGGGAELLDTRITATIEGPLPGDDITQLTTLR